MKTLENFRKLSELNLMIIKGLNSKVSKKYHLVYEKEIDGIIYHRISSSSNKAKSLKSKKKFLINEMNYKGVEIVINE